LLKLSNRCTTDYTSNEALTHGQSP